MIHFYFSIFLIVVFDSVHNLDIPQKVKEYLTLIKGRVARAENLLNGILRYARVSKEERYKEQVDVNQLLTEVREYLPKANNIELCVQPNMPVLFTERVPLLQVFTNLIVNAIKYHDKENGEVKVYHKIAGDFYEFYVEDNGPGIDPLYHDKIFVIFQTLQERDTFESAGVGLAIIKKILDDRNLKIRVTSAPEAGSTFMFTWPKTDL